MHVKCKAKGSCAKRLETRAAIRTMLGENATGHTEIGICSIYLICYLLYSLGGWWYIGNIERRRMKLTMGPRQPVNLPVD